MPKAEKLKMEVTEKPKEETIDSSRVKGMKLLKKKNLKLIIFQIN